MRITQIAPMIYTPGKLEYFSFIRSGAGADYHQNPNFYVFPDGDLIMYWMAYDFDECSNNAVLLYSVSRDRGLTWSDPQVYMADYPNGVPYVRMLRLKNSDQTLMFLTQFRMQEMEVDESRRVVIAWSNYFNSRARVILRRSEDGGQSFDHGEEIPFSLITDGHELPGVGFYGLTEELIQLTSGRILATFIYMDPTRSDAGKGLQHCTIANLISDNGGRTWQRGGEIVVDTPRGAMEPQVVETTSNQLLCLFRTKGGWLYEAISKDGGETWSTAQPSALPSPESMARMIRLQSGNFLVVWNNVSSTTQQPRYPLAAAISRDSGRTWDPPKIIMNEAGTNQLSNHAVTQLDDGRILVGISRYHDIRPMVSDLDMALFDEEWLISNSDCS